MHGTGMHAMFLLMPKLLDKCSDNPEVEEIVKHLNLIAPYCAWVQDDVQWENFDGFGQNVPWNGLENTAKWKNLLTAFILRKYGEELHNADL